MTSLSIDIEPNCSISSMIERSASAPSSPNERSVLREIANINNLAKVRRVTFPDDETIVTGYFEAPDPWSVGPESTDNIVASYRAACWKQGVKPLQKVLLQLQTVHLNGEFGFELNLKGENLVAHHCEALEEIFKRIQFSSLLLEDCNLDDEGAAAIFDMIEYYDTTSHLNISSNKNIGNQGWQACSKMLKRTPCLQYLDASKTNQNEQSLLILGRAFRTGSFLVALHLENCGINGRALVILVAALKLNSTLLELYLGENKICSADGLQLGNLLRSNYTLELLNLQTNNLQDLGVCHLVDGLCQQAANCGECLKTLVLANNSLTRNGMAHINRALLVSESLTSLDLSQNSICNEGIQQMKQGLLTNQSLQDLILVKSQITCEGSVALAEFIADNQHIALIDLRENDIRLAGLMALALSLNHNQSMVNLNVEQTIKDERDPDEVNGEQKLLLEIQEYCLRNRKRIESEQQQDKNVNFVVQSSNVPIIRSEAELTSLIQEKTSQRSQSSNGSNASNIGMVSSASFPGHSKSATTGSSSLQRNRFQVCRVFLDSEKKESSSDISDSAQLSRNEDSSLQSEESVFLPSSPIESGYDSSASSPAVSKQEQNDIDLRKSYIRHQDSIAIHKQHISNATEDDDDDEEVSEEQDNQTNNDTFPGDKYSSHNDQSTSKLMARRSSGGKTVKKLTFVLPDDFTEHSGKAKNNRRMSTPAVLSQKVAQKHNSLTLKLGRQLEGLDLKSSVPLSPTRLCEGLIFPEPFESKIPV
ncbi:protein phosphatase 1 regulatory subunit 37 isoform X2 [Parasteatoda tepidariorum]|uniref:protein phosphatase 1 regulatory subunit 37 isoform X2 n=1 Tax=Parasteatoda tepidariorum TaxID=114398 RepID=UPI001C719BF3|nr:protein phosphatase 1 regulatory subunit 37 isoform X2 [Parasteatoda tepidariorum]